MEPFHLFPVLSLQEETCLQSSSEASEMNEQKERRRERETYKRKVGTYGGLEGIFRNTEELGVGSVITGGK